MWSDDYLKNLPCIVKGSKSNCNLKKGSIVLLREDNVPRMCWPLGLIVDMFPGRDGIVRSVNVQTSKGVFCRPIQKLHDLEIYHDVKENYVVPVDTHRQISNVSDEDDESINNETENVNEINFPEVMMSKSGRVIKPRTVLDL